MTNNSTKSRKGYKGKFEKLGLDVEPEEIFFVVLRRRRLFGADGVQEDGQEGLHYWGSRGSGH